MSSISARELLRESGRSLLARPYLSLLASLAVGALLLGAALLETHALRSLQDAVAEQVEAGSHVLVIDADGSPIPAAPCDALGRAGGVRAAGSVRSVGVVRLADGGAFSFQLAVVSEGYLRVVAPGVSDIHTVVVGAAVSDTLGVRRGSMVRLNDGRSLRVGMSLPSTTRTPDRDRWLLQISPVPSDAAIIECWVESTPGGLEDLRKQIPALFPSVEGLRVRSLVSADVTTAAVSAHENRVARWVWMPVALISAGLLVIALRPRQSEYALYRIVGFSVTDVALMFNIEAWLLLMPSALAFLGAGVGYLTSSGGLTVQTFTAMASITLLGASATSALIAMLTPAMWSADLPRYLKGRG